MRYDEVRPIFAAVSVAMLAVVGLSSEVFALNLSLETDINVRDFGAKGDGVTDDSAAFTAAGNELWKRARPMARTWGHFNRDKPTGSVEGPRPRIVVPKGRYLLKETAVLYSDIVLVGEDGAELVGESPTNDILYLSCCYRVRLENLTFRGGRHSVFAETLNKESANIRITRCRFHDSADIAFLSPSYRNDKGPVGAWFFDKKAGVCRPNPEYELPKRDNNHSSMIVFDDCAFENCEGCISMSPDGSVVRNSTFVMPKGSTNSVFLCRNLMHAYGLKIIHSAGGAAFRSLGCMRLWIESSSVMTSDGSGARVVEGSFGNGAQVSNLVLSDVETDAGLVSDNAICRFTGKFPAIAVLIRVTAKGLNKVRSFVFGPVSDEVAFAASTSANIMNLWEQDRFYSYGIRDCGENVLQIEDGSYAKRFERPVPEWAAESDEEKVRLKFPTLENVRRIVFPGTWQIRTTPLEIVKDTVIDARGVAAFAGMSSDRPWFIVKKGAKALLRNLQVRGGKSFVVVEDGAEAYVDTCFSYDAEGATFVCRKGGRLVVDNGVYYAPRLYEGNGDSFIRSIWYRFTDIVPPGQDFSEGAAIENRGRLVIWDLLGVPTVFKRFGRDMASREPVKRFDMRWVDNYGDYRSRMMRYGGEGGGLMSAWHHGRAKTMIEGSYDWYWNRSIPDTPVMCDAPGADVKMFAVNICLYRQFLKYIGLLYRDKDGRDVPCDSSGLQFICPTAEAKTIERTESMSSGVDN